MPPKPQQAVEDALTSVTDKLENLQLHLDQQQLTLVEKLDQQASSLQSIASSLHALAKSFTQPPPSLDQPTESPTVTHSHTTSPSSHPHVHSSPSSKHPHSQSPFFLKPPKLSMPSFDGSGVLDWIFQAEQYFEFYKIAPDDRMAMIGFYMSGDALSWYKWMYTNRQLSSWDSFVRALELTFGPSHYDNPQGALFKLRQTSSVHDYQLSFARLCNRVLGLPPDAILQCFISGLRPEIQRELVILKPFTLSQAIGMAKLLEAKFTDSRPYSAPPPKPLPTSDRTPLLPTPPQPPTQIRRLSPIEMQERRSKGLCFNCDEKFHPGHKCPHRQFLLITPDDPPDALDPSLDSYNFILTDSTPDPSPFLPHTKFSN